MKGNQAKEMAFCGMMAALAITIMWLGTLIPLATFVCPVLCMLILGFVYKMTGKKLAWAWYFCVALLSVMLSPDKEAVAVMVFLGYYPIIKRNFQRFKLSFVLKMLYFNFVIFVMYSLLIHLFGMDQILAEFAQIGKIMAAVTLVLGNVCLFMVDFLLTRLEKIK